MREVGQAGGRTVIPLQSRQTDRGFDREVKTKQGGTARDFSPLPRGKRSFYFGLARSER